MGISYLFNVFLKPSLFADRDRNPSNDLKAIHDNDSA